MMDALPARSGWRVPKPTASPAPATVEGLLEEGVDALPVRVTIIQDGIRTGWDDGALGFEEGAVWFSGRCCSFRIAAPDVAIPRHENVPGGEGPSVYGFEIRHPARRVRLEMTIIVIEGRREWTDAQKLASRIRQLRRSKVPGGESQYPPLVPRPGLLVPDAKHKRPRWIACGIFALVAGLSVWRPPHDSLLLIPPFVLGAVALGSDARTRKCLERIAAEETDPPSP